MFSLLRRLPLGSAAYIPSRLYVRPTLNIATRGIASSQVWAIPAASTTKAKTTTKAKKPVDAVKVKPRKAATPKAASKGKTPLKKRAVVKKKPIAVRKTIKKKKATVKPKKVPILPGTAPPKRPVSSWTIFASEYIKERYHESSEKGVGAVSKFMKDASSEWSKMSAAQKQVYEERAAAGKAGYLQARTEWARTVNKTSLQELNRRRLARATKAGKPAPFKIHATTRDTTHVKKPLPAFFHYMVEVRKDNHGKPSALLSKEAGAKWRSMTAAEKLPFQHLADAHKKEYLAALEIQKAEHEVHDAHVH